MIKTIDGGVDEKRRGTRGDSIVITYGHNRLKTRIDSSTGTQEADGGARSYASGKIINTNER